MTLSLSKKTLLAAIALAAIHLGVFVVVEIIFPDFYWDERHFWRTTLQFSESLIPSTETIRNYNQLITPLPFMIFGVIEHLFQGGIRAGRAFNIVLTFIMTCSLVFPLRTKGWTGILAACGLMFFCPYYLWYGSLLYTDTIAAFFVLAGFWLYFRDQPIFSGLAFVLAIASRQYMLAFPVAVAVYELIRALQSSRFETLSFQTHSRWLAPALAASTIFGWFVFFDGLAPQGGLTNHQLPAVQASAWAISFAPSLYFLSCIGLYFVLPEWLLFSRQFNWRDAFSLRNTLWLGTLVLLFTVAPITQNTYAFGQLIKIARTLPNDFLIGALFIGLCYLACLRFGSRLNLTFWILLTNCGVMMKAHPWDKYTLPLLVVLWYLKSTQKLDSVPEEEDLAQASVHSQQFS